MATIHRSKTGSGPWLSTEDTGGAEGLPDWWTVDSTPGAENVEFAGRGAFGNAIPASFDTDTYIPLGVYDDGTANSSYAEMQLGVEGLVDSAGTGFVNYLLDAGDTYAGFYISALTAADPSTWIWSITGEANSSGATSFITGTLDGSSIAFFGAALAARPTGVAVSAPAIHAALVSLGLITA
jgi:hypothetical protein